MAEENLIPDLLGDAGGTAETPLLRWREFLFIIVERFWIALTVFVIIVVSTAIWNARQTPMYKARTTLHINMFANRILDLPDVSGSVTPGYLFGQYINTQVRGLRSRLFIEQVAEALKKSQDPIAERFLRKSSNPVGAILGSMKVAPVEDSQLIKIEVRNSDPEVAALLANIIAEEFIEQDRRHRVEASLSAVKWLKEQADAQKKKLTASEMAIQKYRESKDMVSLEQRQDTIVDKLKAVNAALTKAENEASDAYATWTSIQTAVTNGLELDQIPAIASDSRVIAAKDKIIEIKKNIASLKLKYKDKHPKLVAARGELQSARVVYTQACFDAQNRAESEYRMAESKVGTLKTSLERQKQKALELSRMRVEYNALKRNAEADQQLYQNIIVRMKEAQVAGNLDTSNITINDKAYPPSVPYSPKRMQNLIKASFAGLVLGLGLIVLVHMMDDRVRRSEDFEERLGIPVLGLIPKIELQTPQERAMVILHEHDTHAAEAFRMLQASLLLDSRTNKAQVILVVSSGSGEGKSLVSSNLATLFAHNGSKTLLIDADLRRPTQHKLHNIDRKQKGLAHLILGMSDWSESLVKTRQEGLELLVGCGVPTSATPSRLIASNEIKRVIKKARSRYERIIVDSPPVFGVSDPMHLFPLVDAIVFVSFYNKTHLRAIREATRKIFDSGTPLAGAVINSVELQSHSYYYHRYGYNSYYKKNHSQD